MPRTYLVFGEMLWVMVARYFDEVLVDPIDIETVDTALHSYCSGNGPTCFISLMIT